MKSSPQTLTFPTPPPTMLSFRNHSALHSHLPLGCSLSGLNQASEKEKKKHQLIPGAQQPLQPVTTDVRVTINVLDITHRPVLYLKYGVWRLDSVSVFR
jgi:hypothetical protein